jgi:Nucleotidyl transferase AbiEii toxin, Type IV TA system
MNPDFGRFLRLSETDRKDVFESAARRLDTLPSYIEKDFWVCLVLDVLFHNLPTGHPRLLFKGGTSLSKGFNLIQRFSEDIDIVISREDLGFSGERDPVQSGISNKKRKELYQALQAMCRVYVQTRLYQVLEATFANLAFPIKVVIDAEDPDQQTLLVEYLSLFPASGMGYVLPRVKIEGGARSALEPRVFSKITAYIHEDLNAGGWNFQVDDLTMIRPERTLWEKLLILHGLYSGHRDEGRLPVDANRMSRHYYDAVMLSQSALGASALKDQSLWTAVREHNLIAFPQAWKKFDQAVPGTLCLVPLPELRKVLERDYSTMQGMMLGKAPNFVWVMEQIATVEQQLNTLPIGHG